MIVEPQRDELLREAKALAARYAPVWLAGVIPCAPRGKVPIARDWQRVRERRVQADGSACDVPKLALTLAEHVLGGGNVGMTPPPGVVVLDADDDAAAAALEAALPDAPRQRTARGAHFIVRLPYGVAQPRNGVKVALTPDVSVDVRGVGAQIVVAPSTHATGFAYEWERPLPSTVDDLPELPAEWVHALCAAPKLNGHAPPGALSEGERNTALFREACRLRGLGLGEAAIGAQLDELNASRCAPPLSEREVTQIAASAAKYPSGDRHSDMTPHRVDLASIGFSGERLRALRTRPVRAAPLDGFLDPEPSVSVIMGRPKTGKTSLALHLARAWAEGVAPWPDARALPGDGVARRVLMISAEQSALMVDGTARRLQHGAREHGEFELRDEWPERTVLVARDAELSSEARTLLCLNDEGLATLRGVLEEARTAGDPFGLLVLDSLSRLKPAGFEENSNDHMSQFLGALAEMSTQFGVWVLLVHHVGHSADPGRDEARSAGRGASAIAACAATAILIERSKSDARQLTARIDGNAVMSRELAFEVARPEDPPGAVLYFRPVEPLALYKIPDFVKPGEQLSRRELAFRLGDKRGAPRGESPAGADTDLAARLAAKWVGEGRAVESEGKRKSKLLALAEGGPPRSSTERKKFDLRGGRKPARRAKGKP